MVDIDNYIKQLHKEIEHLNNVIISYKKEVKMLRAEYAQMKQERDVALEIRGSEDSTITEETNE